MAGERSEPNRRHRCPKANFKEDTLQKEAPKGKVRNSEGDQFATKPTTPCPYKGAQPCPSEKFPPRQLKTTDGVNRAPDGAWDAGEGRAGGDPDEPPMKAEEDAHGGVADGVKERRVGSDLPVPHAPKDGAQNPVVGTKENSDAEPSEHDGGDVKLRSDPKADEITAVEDKRDVDAGDDANHDGTDLTNHLLQSLLLLAGEKGSSRGHEHPDGVGEKCSC